MYLHIKVWYIFIYYLFIYKIRACYRNLNLFNYGSWLSSLCDTASVSICLIKPWMIYVDNNAITSKMWIITVTMDNCYI